MVGPKCATACREVQAANRQGVPIWKPGRPGPQGDTADGPTGLCGVKSFRPGAVVGAGSGLDFGLLDGRQDNGQQLRGQPFEVAGLGVLVVHEPGDGFRFRDLGVLLE